MKIYGDLISGNCLKVKYTADYLKLSYTWVPIDIMANESHTAEYLARSPQGQVPLLELDDGRCIAQSNAIIRYLAADSVLLPEDLYLQAKVDELLFWEQYSHEPYIAVCRFQMYYLKKSKAQREPWRVERGEAALDHMEAVLQEKDYFVDGRLSIADIALLAYTRMAAEGGFDLGKRPNVSSWIQRCEQDLGLPRCI